MENSGCLEKGTRELELRRMQDILAFIEFNGQWGRTENARKLTSLFPFRRFTSNMSAPKLRIGYVREHFSSPLLQLAEKDQTIELVECPSASNFPVLCFSLSPSFSRLS